MDNFTDINELNKILGNLNSMVEEGTGKKDADIELMQESIKSIQELDEAFKVYEEKGVSFKTVTKFKNISDYKDPYYSHNGDSGFDLRANIKDPITLKSLERKLIPTGLEFQLSPNTELQVRPRSGMALKHGLSVLNTPGTVDEGYRGEVGVIVINLSGEEYTINPGDRIAQGVIMNVIGAGISELVNTDKLDITSRGDGGFGSTGK